MNFRVLTHIVHNLVQDERGVDLVEHWFLLSIVAVVGIAFLHGHGPSWAEVWPAGNAARAMAGIRIG